MQGTIRDLAKRFPISTLFPATQPLYRRAGYEQAGSWLMYWAPPRDLDCRDRTLQVRTARPAEAKSIKELYARQARRLEGLLDRSPLMWERIFRTTRAKNEAYLILNGKRPEGYTICERKGTPGDHFNLLIHDHAALTPEAARRLFTFYADHHTLVRQIVWQGGPIDEIQMHLREQRAKVSRMDRWMLRILDVPRALSDRGYPSGLEESVDLEIKDDLIPKNQGRFTLKVADGRARAARGGSGAVRLDIRRLASLYTGYLNPDEHPGIEGPKRELEKLRRIFAGPTPWMVETF
jgi:predicted acetyltransferase